MTVPSSAAHRSSAEKNTANNDAKSDETLVAEAKAGSEVAFKVLVERHQDRVATTVRAMLGNATEAEDVGQETFIRFYRALDAFRGDSSVSTYLNRIAINLSLNALKRRKRFFARFQQTDEQLIADSRAVMPDVDQAEHARIIERALMQLKPAFRAVVVLRMIEGYSTQETADMLDLPLGTVLSRLSRAQEKLRDALRPYFSDEKN